MNRLIIRLMMIVGLLCFVPSASFAQSASASYNKGLSLMNSGDYQGAIASFKASMAINKSADNVKKCKAQIAKCNRLAKRKSGDSSDSGPVQKQGSKQLNITTTYMVFDAETEATKKVGVSTLPESSDWTANVASESEAWCKLSKSMDGKELEVTCQPSASTIKRQTGITVIYGDATKFITLVQNGRKPVLEATPNKVRMKVSKDDEEKIAISCNSDTLYSDNKNWELVEYPDWCTVEVTSGNELTVKTKKVEKSDPVFKNGRFGIITVRSQSEKFSIRVDQEDGRKIKLFN